jgi:hypothetical protein
MPVTIGRRELLVALGGAAAAWPLAAWALQPMAKLPTIGFLGSATLLVECGAIEAIGDLREFLVEEDLVLPDDETR